MIGLFDSKSFLVSLYNFNFESLQISCCYDVLLTDFGEKQLIYCNISKIYRADS